MNMLPLARLSLILCAALAAGALYLSGDSSGWITFTLVAGGVALLVLDRLRWIRPLPSALGFIPILGAAGFAVWDWQAGGGNARSAADACVHFILLCQIAAIFSDLSGPQIGMSLAGSVILLLVSVKHQPHAGHLPLMLGLLTATTAAMIFRVALGRQTEFQAMTARTQRSGDRALVPPDRRFGWRMAYITLILAVLATGFGLTAFFFLPRVSLAAAQEDGPGGHGRKKVPHYDFTGNPTDQDIRLDGGDGDGEGDGGGGNGRNTAGFESKVRLDSYGKILTDPTPALHISREKIDSSKALPGGLIYLRGTTLTDYRNGAWDNQAMPAPQQLAPSEDGRWLQIDWEQDRNQVLGAGVFELVTVHDRDADHHQRLFVPGAADRIDNRPSPGAVWRYGDGGLRVVGSTPQQYRFLCQVTPQPLAADDPAACAHPFAIMTGVSINRRETLLELAGRAAGGATTDQGKAAAILRFLRDSGDYQYTLDLPPIPKGEDNRPQFADPIEYFLFGSKRGHCACFATAYVMLARLNRIPARLASGYVAQVQVDQTEAEVPHSAAHAWVEVYLADKGWITVDPTPPGALDLARRNPTPPPGTPTGPGQDPNLPAGADNPKAPEPPTNPILEYDSANQNRLYMALRDWLEAPVIPLPGLSVRVWHLLALLVVLAATVLIRRKMNAADEFDTIDGVAVRSLRPRIVFYRRMLAIMKSRGKVRKPSQSATEYAQMLTERRDAAAPAVRALTDLYLLLRFGMLDEPRRKAIFAENRAAVKQHLDTLEVLLTAEKTLASEGGAS